MKQTVLMKSLPVVGILAACLAGCGSGGGAQNADTNPIPPASTTVTNPDGSISTTRKYGDLVFTLTAPKRVYALRETVPLTFTVQNTGTTDASSTYTHSGPNLLADAIVRTPSGRIVTFLGNYFGGANIYTGTLVYKAGETQTYPMTWRQNDNGGPYVEGAVGPPQAAAGTYKIRASVSANELNGQNVGFETLGTESLEIEIR